MAIHMSVLIIINAVVNFKNYYKMNENSTDRTSLFQRKNAVL